VRDALANVGTIDATAKAHPASPIAAALADSEIWVVWLDEEKKLRTASPTYPSNTWRSGKPTHHARNVPYSDHVNANPC
jgi:hypothetical protein